MVYLFIETLEIQRNQTNTQVYGISTIDDFNCLDKSQFQKPTSDNPVANYPYYPLEVNFFAIIALLALVLHVIAVKFLIN